MFTQREMELLSDGILCLIGNVDSAAAMLFTSARESVMREIRAYRDELNDLNSRLCAAMDEEEKQEIYIVVKDGLVQGVSRNANSNPIEALVLDLDGDINPTYNEEIEEAYADYCEKIKSGEIIPIW